LATGGKLKITVILAILFASIAAQALSLDLYLKVASTIEVLEAGITYVSLSDGCRGKPDKKIEMRRKGDLFHLKGKGPDRRGGLWCGERADGLYINFKYQGIDQIQTVYMGESAYPGDLIASDKVFLNCKHSDKYYGHFNNCFDDSGKEARFGYPVSLKHIPITYLEIRDIN
jgi:hypothetical protein